MCRYKKTFVRCSGFQNVTSHVRTGSYWRMDVFLQNKEMNVGTGRDQVNQNKEQRGEFMWGISRPMGEGSPNMTVKTGTRAVYPSLV